MDLNALINELSLLVRHKLKNYNVQLVRELEPNLPPVPGDTAGIPLTLAVGT